MNCSVHRQLGIALAFSLVSLTTEAAIVVSDSSTQHRTADTPSSCGGQVQAVKGITVEQVTLRGVPGIIRKPAVVTQPPLILLHGFGPPATPDDLMRALPLDDVPAVKIYLWLPLFGPRTPPGGRDELVRRQTRDFVTLLFAPAVIGAANELPEIIEALRSRRCYGIVDEVSLFGFSAGGSAVLYALTEKKMRVRAAVILNTPPNLDATISAFQHATNHEYQWSPRSRHIADQADTLRHGRKLASGKLPPPLLIIQGAADSLIGVNSATALEGALRPHYHRHNHDDRLQATVVPGVAHEWAGSAALDDLRMRTSTWFNLPWD